MKKVGIVSWYAPDKGAFLTELSDRGSGSEDAAKRVFIPVGAIANRTLRRGQLVQYESNDADPLTANAITPLSTYLDEASL